MKKLILGFVFILSFNSHAQEKNKFVLNPWDSVNGYRFGGGYYKDLELEASYLMSSYPDQEQGFGGMAMRVEYVGAGIEYLRIGNENVFGAKLSYENSLAFFSGQIASDFLFTDKATQVRILSKIGLSLFGKITLYYGWNLNLIQQSELQTQNHVISLQMNLLN